jgi:hypothetical protein
LNHKRILDAVERHDPEAPEEMRARLVQIREESRVAATGSRNV